MPVIISPSRRFLASQVILLMLLFPEETSAADYVQLSAYLPTTGILPYSCVESQQYALSMQLTPSVLAERPSSRTTKWSSIFATCSPLEGILLPGNSS